MSLTVLDGNSASVTLSTGTGTDGNTVIGNPQPLIYRVAGSLTAAQGAAAAKDVLLLTASATGVTRILSIRTRLVGGGTATVAGGVGLTLNRVTAAPTGQSNVVVTPRPQIGTTTAGSTAAITPSTTQTAGTTPLVIGATVLAVNLTGTANDLFGTSDGNIAAGPEFGGSAIVIPASGFVTLRVVAALPTASVLYFDIAIAESAA